MMGLYSVGGSLKKQERCSVNKVFSVIKTEWEVPPPQRLEGTLVAQGLVIELSRSHSDSSEKVIGPNSDLYSTTHNTHKRKTCMPSAEFEAAISAGERPQTYALDRVATGTDKWEVTERYKGSLFSPQKYCCFSAETSSYLMYFCNADIFLNYEEVETAIHEWMRIGKPYFWRAVLYRLVPRWEIIINVLDDYSKQNNNV